MVAHKGLSAKIFNFFNGLCMTLIVTVSICEQLIDIHKSYDRALNAMTNGNSSNTSHIYSHVDDTSLNYSIYIPIDFESKITECIYTHNHDLINIMIDDVFEKNFGIPNIYMRSVVTTLISVYTKLCKKIGIESDYDDSINDEYRVDVIKSYIKQLYQSVEADVVHENKAGAVGDFIINYIKENYSNPAISMESIAEEMNLSPSYISTLFKKATGIAFSQYLLQYRIDRAKEMLENTDKKIKEISEQSGFGTYNNFVRMFRKKIGIAPSEYRNKL